MIKKLLVCTMLMGFATGLFAKDYQASMFGIKSDGTTLNTRSIQKAVDFISAQGGGKLVFWVGRYLTGTVELKSNVTIELKEGAALVAVDSPYEYNLANGSTAVFYAKNQSNIRIFGKGLIVGHSSAVMACLNEQFQKGHIKGNAADFMPSAILLDHCDGIQFDGITLEDTSNTALVLKACKNVTFNKVTVSSTVAGAVSLSNCEGVQMTGCYFDTKVPAVITDGTSSNLKFDHCVIPNGTAVSVDK